MPSRSGSDINSTPVTENAAYMITYKKSQIKCMVIQGKREVEIEVTCWPGCRTEKVVRNNNRINNWDRIYTQKCMYIKVLFLYINPECYKEAKSLNVHSVVLSSQ